MARLESDGNVYFMHVIYNLDRILQGTQYQELKEEYQLKQKAARKN